MTSIILDTQLFIKDKYLRTGHIYSLSKSKYTHSIKWCNGREVKPLTLNLRAGVGSCVQASLGVNSFHEKYVAITPRKVCHAGKLQLVVAQGLHSKSSKSCQQKNDRVLTSVDTQKTLIALRPTVSAGRTQPKC